MLKTMNLDIKEYIIFQEKQFIMFHKFKRKRAGVRKYPNIPNFRLTETF